ncbi:MAG: YtxH domain-containing protein [Bacteroidetes bacterium]|jgi:hypothetical protein|nr:MAG: YtxH domain-containing protein [Bacteroidota bacterium]
MQKKLLGLILAAAAYGIYRYTKMTPEQKAELKRRGGDFLDKNLGSFNNLFGERSAVTDTTNKFS